MFTTSYNFWKKSLITIDLDEFTSHSSVTLHQVNTQIITSPCFYFQYLKKNHERFSSGVFLN